MTKPLNAGAFIQEWSLDLPLRGSAKDFYLAGDRLFLQGADNTVFSVSTGGELRFGTSVTSKNERLGRAALVEDQFVFPLTNTLVVFDGNGRRGKTVTLDRPIRSPITAEGESLYLGVDASTGGRLAKVQPLKPYAQKMWEVQTGPVGSQPVVYQDVIYIANREGRVVAVSPSRGAVWALPDSSFRADRGVVAPLVADDYALYVASEDFKLYALDRANGKIRWRYFAERRLIAAPYLADDRVYQGVPDIGVAAINKFSGDDFRKPVWLAKGVKKVIFANERAVYGLSDSGHLVALSHETGELLYRSTQGDFIDAVSVPSKSGPPTLIAATQQGDLVAARPNERAGSIGTLVMR